ncbi:FlgD immunoglobulin-like domain containing protein [Rhodothermus marinus]|uniref:FlgD immunoglobulin-like domain containing protein n=1 Tax=Rhodothermus marinus TaxID=29549 RepID=UPI0037CC132A
MRQPLRFGILTLALLLAGAAPLFAQEAIPLENPSFEQAPDGSTPCIRVTDWDQIPGWNMDAPAQDSGVSENANATDGTCAAWLASQDPAIWQLTDYVIQENDVITMYVDLRNSWMAYQVQIAIIYEYDGERRIAAADTVEVFDVMTEYSVSFTASDVPEAIGRRVGVSIDNIGDDGTYIEIDNVRLFRSTATAREEGARLPEALTLAPAYPNPFRDFTRMQYTLRQAGPVELVLYDLLGRPVRTLVRSFQAAGTYVVQWDGRDESGRLLPAGVYFARLSGVGASVQARPIVLRR